MAITRIQSIKFSSIGAALRHRLNPGRHEFLVQYLMSVDPSFGQIGMLEALRQLSGKTKLREFFKFIESAAYSRKIRKNAVLHELIVAYDRNEDGLTPETHSNLSEDGHTPEPIRMDIKAFLRAFREEFGFFPASAFFVHSDGEKFHVHILFSLMKPDFSGKVRFRKQNYFRLVKRMSELSPRIRASSPPKKRIGAYPMWLMRLIEAEIGREKAKRIVRKARTERLSAVQLYQMYEDGKLLSLLQSRRRRSPRPPSP